jgi:hypothetical protein
MKKKLKTIDFKNKFILKSQSSENITKVEFQLDHIWANSFKINVNIV